MPSSPAESTLAAIAQRYADARHAVRADDLTGAQALIGEVEGLLGLLPPADTDGAPERSARQQARVAFDQLCQVVQAARDGVADDLAQQRRGQRTLSAYGGRLPVAGTRVERDG